MEDTRSDFARGLDKGLEMALDLINRTAKTQFKDVAEVAMYVYDPEQYAHFKNQTEKEPA